MDSKRSGRRRFLEQGGAALAGLAAGAVSPVGAQTPAAPAAPAKSVDELVKYGERSRFVTSIRVPQAQRPSPDRFGMLFHICTPLQDQLGMVTPNSLHYVGTHRGARVPEINPAEHRLMVHGMVDRPTIFTMDDLKRMPFVSRFHFIECLGNRAQVGQPTVQDTHGMTSCAEWTGVPLSLLLKECGVQNAAKWVVVEGDEHVKGASCIELGKAMDDCIVAYGQNGEPVRPQQGFPLRLVVPGYEGIFNTKYIRRIKVTDEYYLTFNDYGHIRETKTAERLGRILGPKSVITYPSGTHKLNGPGFYEVRGLAWSGGGAIKKVEVSFDNGKTWKNADLRSQAYRMAHTFFAYSWKWDGKECVIMSRCIDEKNEIQPSRAEVAKYFNTSEGAATSPGVMGMNNTIMPWKVAADGSVTNGLS